jgi:UDP-2-acetamido-3-amino-2,3-dideoxy-glucuronate N-acetyltransferase
LPPAIVFSEYYPVTFYNIIGNGRKIQNNVSFYEGMTLEEDVFVGPSVVFTNVKIPKANIKVNNSIKTLVQKGASIGANSTIVCGHDIGEYAFIGAGTVVTKTVLPFALIVGNPGRQIGWMSEYGHQLEFNEYGEAVCQESGERYELKDGAVSKVGTRE